MHLYEDICYRKCLIGFVLRNWLRLVKKGTTCCTKLCNSIYCWRACMWHWVSTTKGFCQVLVQHACYPLQLSSLSVSPPCLIWFASMWRCRELMNALHFSNRKGNKAQIVWHSCKQRECQENDQFPQQNTQNTPVSGCTSCKSIFADEIFISASLVCAVSAHKPIT